MTTRTRLMTADELLERSSELGVCELVRGELRRLSPGGWEHGTITMRIAQHVIAHALAHELGKVVSPETGFILERDPDTVREADVPFVAKHRLPRQPLAGYFEGAPDLAVEVLSPNDRVGDVADKVDLWLEKGSRLVWVVDPRRRTVTVHRRDQRPRVLHADETLEGEDVLPGFRLPVLRVFED